MAKGPHCTIGNKTNTTPPGERERDVISRMSDLVRILSVIFTQNY